MPPERQIPFRVRWEFCAEDGPASSIVWRWRAYDVSGKALFESQQSFEMLTDCVADAKRHGYIEPELRT